VNVWSSWYSWICVIVVYWWLCL